MIWDFNGRRPLPVRDYVISIKGGRKNQFFRYNLAKHELAKLLIIYMTTRDHPRSNPHGPGPAWVGGP